MTIATMIAAWRFALVIALLVAALLPQRALAKDQVWFETPVAEVSIGFDASINATRQRAFYLAFVGPKEAISNPSVARACAEITVKPLRDRLRGSLDAAHARAAQQSADIAARTQNDLHSTSRALLSVTLNVEGDFFKCIRDRGAPALLEKNFYLSLVQRDCTPSYCPLSRTRTRLSRDADAPVFSSLYRWLSVRSAVEQRNVTDQHFRLKFRDMTDESVVLEADFEPIEEVNAWPTALPQDKLTSQFVALIGRVRDGDSRHAGYIEYSSALVVGVGRNDIIRIGDALSQPEEAFALAEGGGADLLSGVSNELARLQITECRRYRGLTVLADMASCTGLPLTQAQLTSCLSGAACDPTIPDAIKTAAFFIDRPQSLDDLSVRVPLPRYLPTDMAGLKAQYDRCSGSPQQIQRCAVDRVFEANPQLASARSCLARARQTDQISCAMSAFGAEAPPQMRCAALASRKLAECLLAPALPDDARAAWNCSQRAGGNDRVATCLAGLAGGDVGRIATCRSQNSANNLLLAACVAGDRLDPAVRQGLECVSESGVTAAGLAACAVSTQLPPAVSAQIGCVVQSKGEPIGAGVCIATSSLDLQPNQQLALQCLASTGGEPQSFAVCFFGQLTMQEMVKCKGKSFGEADCFGPNNEIQRFARLITGSEIGPNSVVGQMVTVYLKPAQLAFTVAEPVINLATDAIGRVSAAVSRTADDIEKAEHGDVTGIVNTAAAPFVVPLRIFFPSL